MDPRDQKWKYGWIPAIIGASLATFLSLTGLYGTAGIIGITFIYLIPIILLICNDNFNLNSRFYIEYLLYPFEACMFGYYISLLFWIAILIQN